MEVSEVAWLVFCLASMLPLLLLVLTFLLRPPRPAGKLRTSLVLGSGGHTTELLKLARSLDPSIYSPRTYYVAETDRLSVDKAREVEGELGGRREYAQTGDFSIVQIPR